MTVQSHIPLPGKKSYAQLLEGWQVNTLVTLQTGVPVAFYDGGNDFTATGEGENNLGNDRWNNLGPASNVKFSPHGSIPYIQPGDPQYGSCLLAGNNDPGLLASLSANGGCFVSHGTILYPNAPGTYGNMQRNMFRGLGFYDWDASVAKNWNLTERFKLQFRAEAFNLLNHPIFSTSSIKKDLYSSTLGQIRGTPDVWASNPVIGSGGSRHIQLGLKVIW